MLKAGDKVKCIKATHSDFAKYVGLEGVVDSTEGFIKVKLPEYSMPILFVPQELELLK